MKQKHAKDIVTTPTVPLLNIIKKKITKYYKHKIDTTIFEKIL